MIDRFAYTREGSQSRRNLLRRAIDEKLATEMCLEIFDNALAEKDREIEAKETELGKLDAELIVLRGVYQHLMAQAIRFAQLAGAHAPCQVAYDFLQSPDAQAFLKEHLSHDTQG